MKKTFEALSCIFILLCAAYGAYVLVKKFLARNNIEESDEFDDLYDEYMASCTE